MSPRQRAASFPLHIILVRGPRTCAFSLEHELVDEIGGAVGLAVTHKYKLDDIGTAYDLFRANEMES